MMLQPVEIDLLSNAISGLFSLTPKQRTDLAAVVGCIAVHAYTVERVGKFIMISPPAPDHALCASTTPKEEK